jgi:hypothetical protein
MTTSKEPIHVAFPQNRIIPELVYSPAWLVGDVVVDLIRIAPKQCVPLPAALAAGAKDDAYFVKLLRGETSEVPTPLAACKACRSCHVPGYLRGKYIKAGAEGAVMLRSRPRHTVDISDAELIVLPLSSPTIDVGGIGSKGISISQEFVVTEGCLHVCRFTLLLAEEGASSEVIQHQQGSIFGEIGVVLGGELAIKWERTNPEPSSNGTVEAKVLVVPTGFEYGPFYEVHSCGSLKRNATSGHLVYTPHQWTFPSKTVCAICHFEVPDASLEGPHRHCYT